ncbi:unnamed protein product [Phytophthora fragariaefolia]|uniref:Unnamed protein product n=1 Tax=Phytophthora fragariaefolia TaxID=1490495 RepID=A0A9W6XYN4_9STRA|nr:unnamed protein product [Phytophthora fragariaefolia]
MHRDYLYLGESYGEAKYVFVLKDELTHYCELVAADSANSQTDVAAVLDWHKRVMLMENQLDTRNWANLLPLIQANLNHSPVLLLGDCTPMELFTGLPAPSALDVVVTPQDKLPRTLPLEEETFRQALEELRTSLHALHRVARDRRERSRTAAMARSKGTVCNFSEGDYVLWSRVDQRLQGGKLLVRWVGSFLVAKGLPHSFLIRHLLTGAEYDVHGSRLKFYYDGDLNVTAEIHEHISLQGIVLEVREIVDHRVSTATGSLELLVAWRGLQDIENSW